MLPLGLAFVAGALWPLTLSTLPPATLYPAGAGLALALACVARTRPAAAFLAGALLSHAAAGDRLAARLPAEQSGNEFSFVAQIIDFTKVTEGRAALRVAPMGRGLPPALRLSWYEADSVPRPGQRWHFTARLKRPRGTRNPGSFDYEGWLHREGFGATGYVLSARLLDPRPARALARLRDRQAARIESLLPPGEARAALLAIAIGARHRITVDGWRRYAQTGTTHLMAISGLHVGMAAAGAAALAWLCLGLCGYRGNLRDAATIAALPAMFAYALLSGFDVPARRAAAMAAAAAIVLLLRRPPRPAVVLAGVAALLVAADPLALLTPGFWLSFGAVAVLLAAARRRGAPDAPSRRLATLAHARELTGLQIALLFGLFPATAFAFARSAWVAPLANLLVLPVFSLLTVPAALLGLVLDGPLAPLGDRLLALAWHSLRAVTALLDWLATLPAAGHALAMPRGAARALFLVPALWVLLPRGWPGRRVAVLAWLAALLWRPAPPPPGCFDLHTLDVGQGLAQVVQTANAVVVFDTGPAWPGGSSAERVVLPFLASLGVRRIDRLVVSHGDRDHAGGTVPLTAGLPVGDLLAGEPLPAAESARPCRAGVKWRRDGVHFRVLHPANGLLEGNDASCVLEVAAGERRALLTGDIGRGVERRLRDRGVLRPVDLVGVPHHGSRTSSSAAFVGATRPAHAVVSAGYANRWGFPKDEVTARWRRRGAELLSTATSGAIRHRACAGRPLELLDEFRKSARRYWHDVEP